MMCELYYIFRVFCVGSPYLPESIEKTKCFV